MGVVEIVLVGIALSMDAVAVTMTNGMVYREDNRMKMLISPILFGIFQGMMPLLGYYIGGIFSEFITRYSGIIVCIILGIIGVKMIKDGLSHNKESGEDTSQQSKVLTYKILVIQAVATSIDAFAVGVGFSAMRVNILPTVIIIAVITIICCILAMLLGKKFGDLIGDKSELIGGGILVLLALQSLLD